MSRQYPAFATSLISLVPRTVHVEPGERVCRFKQIAGTTAAAMLISWAAGVSAQTASGSTPPPLPPVVQSDAPQNNAKQPDIVQPAPQQTETQQQPQQLQSDTQQGPSQEVASPANDPTANLPPLPLGHDGVREVQSQLIALGFDPGPVDSVDGPATIAAAQQYNENRGGSGPVPINDALLARLKHDTGPRLTPEQIAARPAPRYQAPAAANPLANLMQQLDSNLRTLFNGR